MHFRHGRGTRLACIFTCVSLRSIVFTTRVTIKVLMESYAPSCWFAHGVARTVMRHRHYHSPPLALLLPPAPPHPDPEHLPVANMYASSPSSAAGGHRTTTLLVVLVLAYLGTVLNYYQLRNYACMLL